MQHPSREKNTRRRVAWLIVPMLSLTAFGVLSGPAGGLTAPASQPMLWSRPNLPIEKEEVVLTFRVPLEAQGSHAQPVRLQIIDPQGKPLVTRVLPLTQQANSMEASLPWRPPKNGLYQVMARHAADPPVRLDLPIVAARRRLDFVWYSYRPWMRWATVIASAGKEDVPELRERGIKALRWMYGANHPIAKEYGRPEEELAAEAERYYSVPQGFEFDGYGLDEFGAYPGTEWEERSLAWRRGLVKARQELPKDFIVAAWHGGGVRDEWVGLYRQAADFLLLEAYEMYYAPHELGTENIFEDLRGRLIAPRGADLFTGPYGARCKVLLSLDLCGPNGTYGNAGELEQVIRFIRREFPEMRGISFFGTGAIEALDRAADRLCYDYFILPVVTFQHNSLWLDRFSGQPQIVAAVSNIGGMDSGPVTVRLKVNGRVVGEQRTERVPAGNGRLANRSLLRWKWTAQHPGQYELEAQVVAAPGSTVLDASVRESRWIAADRKHEYR
jgi:hypothetical protein